MRVIHVVPTQFGPGLLGGGERYPLELARALSSQVDCRLVTFGRMPAKYREPTGLRVDVIRPLGCVAGHPAHPLAPQLLWNLGDADIIHTHHMRSLPSRFSAIGGRLRGIRTAVTDHGLQGDDWGGLLPRLFDRFLSVSRYSALELGAPHARTTVIYGGANPQRFKPQPDVRRDGVLFVGRITPHKGVDRLIRALPHGARLTIAGSEGHDPHPPERNYPSLLRRLAAGRDVDFVGPVSEGQLPDLYRRAAVLILPSVAETCYGRDIRVSELLGLVVLEAMASGTPVICSRLGGLPEIVEQGENGFLVEPGNVNELHHRIRQLLSDRRLAERMGRRARALVCERFTWEACAARCLRAYQDLIGSGIRQSTGPS